MGELFARAFTEQSLLEGWEVVRNSALADGLPDAEVAAFEPQAAGRVAGIAAALAAGEWSPQPAG